MNPTQEQSATKQLRNLEYNYHELMKDYTKLQDKCDSMSNTNRRNNQKIQDLNKQLDHMYKSSFNPSERSAMQLEIDKLRMENRQLKKKAEKYHKLKSLIGEEI